MNIMWIDLDKKLIKQILKNGGDYSIKM